MRGPLAALGAVLVLSCGSAEIPTAPDAREQGAALFSSTRAGSASNPFSCATCHAVRDAAPSPGDLAPPARIYPGADLAGVTLRPSYWGGAELDLLAAVNACRMHMMDAPSPWRGDERDARVLYTYLASLAGPSAPRPFRLSFTPPPRAPADPARGGDLFRRACAPCHGDGSTAPVATFIPRLPDGFRAAHPGLDPWPPFYAHVRAGGFEAQGQSMPPFSTDVLSDDDVLALAAFLAL